MKAGKIHLLKTFEDHLNTFIAWCGKRSASLNGYWVTDRKDCTCKQCLRYELASRR